MSREIKFRHWIPSTGVMTGGNHPHTFILTSDGKESFWKDTVWLQFTGLHDRNGKEIYEGDIVRAADGVYRHEINYRVFWDHSYYSWRAEKLTSNYKLRIEEDLFHLIARKPEVIGNIYRNEDLLK